MWSECAGRCLLEKLSDRSNNNVVVDSRVGGGYSPQIPRALWDFSPVCLSLWEHSKINEAFSICEHVVMYEAVCDFEPTIEICSPVILATLSFMSKLE